MMRFLKAHVSLAIAATLCLSSSAAFSATAILSGSTGGSCSYSTFSVDGLSGTLNVTCDNVVQPTGPGIIKFTTSSSNSTKAGNAINLSVQRTDGTNGAVSATVTSSIDSSIAGYESAQSQQVNFATGSSSASVSFPTTANTVAKGTKNLTFTVSAATGGATIGAPSTTSVAITDNISDIPSNCTVKNITWQMGPVHLGADPQHSMPDGTTMAFKVVMPARGAVISSLNYSFSPKFLSISKKPCSFEEVSIPSCSYGGGINKPQVRNTTGTNLGFCRLEAGQEYYFNVKHGSTATDRSTCTNGTICTFYLEW